MNYCTFTSGQKQVNLKAAGKDLIYSCIASQLSAGMARPKYGAFISFGLDDYSKL